MTLHRRLLATAATAALFAAIMSGCSSTPEAEPRRSIQVTDEDLRKVAQEPLNADASVEVGVSATAIPGTYRVDASVDAVTLSAAGDHVDGQGHLEVLVDGEFVTRLFGQSTTVELAPGVRDISVVLVTNDQRRYVTPVGPVRASVVIDVPTQP